MPRGQYEAALALNLSPARRMRRIILPQALLIMLPPWGNLFIELLKATALVALISVTDLMFQAKQINGYTFLSVEGVRIGARDLLRDGALRGHARHAVAGALQRPAPGEGLSDVRLALGLHLRDPAPP